MSENPYESPPPSSENRLRYMRPSVALLTAVGLYVTGGVLGMAVRSVYGAANVKELAAVAPTVFWLVVAITMILTLASVLFLVAAVVLFFLPKAHDRRP